MKFILPIILLLLLPISIGAKETKVTKSVLKQKVIVVPYGYAYVVPQVVKVPLRPQLAQPVHVKPVFRTPVRNEIWRKKVRLQNRVWYNRYMRYNRLGYLLGSAQVYQPVYPYKTN